jgi:hypothetical protein
MSRPAPGQMVLQNQDRQPLVQTAGSGEGGGTGVFNAKQQQLNGGIAAAGSPR